jgi:hypothetical protein
VQVNITIERSESLWLRATADVAGAWRHNDRGFGAFGSGSLPYPGDRSIEITLNLRVRPYNSSGHFSEFPRDLIAKGDLEWNGDPDLGLYAVRRGQVGVIVCAGALRDELERNEDDPIYFEKIALIRSASAARIQMNVSIAVRSAPSRPRGDIPEWHTQFFQGGLPSLGKRRP